MLWTHLLEYHNIKNQRSNFFLALLHLIGFRIYHLLINIYIYNYPIIQKLLSLMFVIGKDENTVLLGTFDMLRLAFFLAKYLVFFLGLLSLGFVYFVKNSLASDAIFLFKHFTCTSLLAIHQFVLTLLPLITKRILYWVIAQYTSSLIKGGILHLILLFGMISMLWMSKHHHGSVLRFFANNFRTLVVLFLIGSVVDFFTFCFLDIKFLNLDIGGGGGGAMKSLDIICLEYLGLSIEVMYLCFHSNLYQYILICFMTFDLLFIIAVAFASGGVLAAVHTWHWTFEKRFNRLIWVGSINEDQILVYIHLLT
ncbi:hypothetical protein ACJX0J_009951, partial [Zea mays]